MITEFSTTSTPSSTKTFPNAKHKDCQFFLLHTLINYLQAQQGNRLFDLNTSCSHKNPHNKQTSQKTQYGVRPILHRTRQIPSKRFADPEFDHNEISQIIKEYASIDDCPLLTSHYAFQKWIGNEYYDHITSASYIVNHIFETTIHITYIKAPKPIKRGEKIPIRIPTPSLKQEEKEWKHALALTFFNLITTKLQTKLKQPQDQNIQNYIKETFIEEISKKKKDIQN